MTTAEMTRSGQSASGASGSQTNQELKADADRLKDTAKDRASEMAGKRKDQATGAARSTADALQKAAGELESDSNAPSWLTSAFRETAKGIDRFAGKVEGRSPEEIGRQIKSFAREHPTSFLAASAAAGFAAARFLRAGADYEHHRQSSNGSTGYQSGQSRAFDTAGSRFANETRTAQQRRDTNMGSMAR